FETSNGAFEISNASLEISNASLEISNASFEISRTSWETSRLAFAVATALQVIRSYLTAKAAASTDSDSRPECRDGYPKPSDNWFPGGGNCPPPKSGRIRGRDNCPSSRDNCPKASGGWPTAWGNWLERYDRSRSP